LMIKNVILGLLEIGGKSNESVQLNWANPLPSNLKENTEIGILQKQIGVSEDTILKRAGFNPDHEREMREQETANLGDALGRAFDGGANS
jgi:hypothetical protein